MADDQVSLSLSLTDIALLSQIIAKLGEVRQVETS